MLRTLKIAEYLTLLEVKRHLFYNEVFAIIDSDQLFERLVVTLMTLTIDEQNMKRMMKEALLELFEERQELFYELISEVIEDAGLIQSVKEGEVTECTSRDEVFAVLDDNT